MTAPHTTALELLGKNVSFEFSHFETQLEKLSGKVTAVVIHISSNPEILLDDREYYVLSDLKNFRVLP